MLLNIIHLEHRTDRLILLKKELNDQCISKYKIWNGIVDPIITARGISQAHKQVVMDAREKKLPEVLICEDDIHFTAEGAFDFFITNKPSDFDVYLGSIHEGIISEDNSVNDFSGATIYIVNERFYDVFLSLPENLNIDRALCNKGKFIVCNPFIAIQHNGFSDNVKRFYNHEVYLQGRSLYGIN